MGRLTGRSDFPRKFHRFRIDKLIILPYNRGMFITRYVAIVAVFLHCLLCGGVNCCEMTCSPKNDAAAVSHESSCPCHSERQDVETEGKTPGDNDCDHQHHFCRCLQSVPPNNGISFRAVLNQNQFALPVAFFSATSLIPTQVSGHRTLETVGDLSAFGVRLHLLLEHFLI